MYTVHTKNNIVVLFYYGGCNSDPEQYALLDHNRLITIALGAIKAVAYGDARTKANNEIHAYKVRSLS